MPATRRELWTHRLAVVVLALSLLPIAMGALTTTLGAGMAFLDWPTSDGENMLLYNMLRDVRLGQIDKVAEHGHRLAGAFIGLLAIGLAVMGWKDVRPGVRTLTLAVLLGVIGQGLLGGIRVRLESTALALGHGLFGACVFALMALAAAATSRHWEQMILAARGDGLVRPPRRLVALTVLTVLFILGQYLLGGLVRHFGIAIPEHLSGVGVVAVVALGTAMFTLQTGIEVLRRYAWFLHAALLLQIALGVGAWATRFGFAAIGYVPVERSVPQVALRSGHTIGGMILLAAAVLLCVMTIRLRMASHGARFSSNNDPAKALPGRTEPVVRKDLAATGAS